METRTMKITHFGHACVLLEIPTPGTEIRLLIDPGTYSTGFEELRGLTAVLITHSHPDHIDIDRLTALLAANPTADVVADSASAALLSGLDRTVTTVKPGDKLGVAEVRVDVIGGAHACIHAALPNVLNNGYVIDGSILHPGDDLETFLEGHAIEVLLIPVGGPWMKIGEAVDFLRRVAPRVAIPIHQAGLAEIHQQLHYQLLRNLGPDGCELVVLEPGTALAV
ncbi:MBL fold metallo-hydrolase [Nocardia sp. NPDC004278]